VPKCIETSHNTQESAPTGAYNINLYLVKDGKAKKSTPGEWGTAAASLHWMKASSKASFG